MNDHDICYLVSRNANRQRRLPASRGLHTVFETNFDKYADLAKWQYFGTEEGAFVVYPVREKAGCDGGPGEYDPRFRYAGAHARNECQSGRVSLTRNAARDVKVIL